MDRVAQDIFDDLLVKSANQHGSSGTACRKLCGFVENSTKSSVPQLREWAFSHDVGLRLCNFFIEWNEVEQHRSMRLILDMLPSLLKRNPDPVAASAIKLSILDILISIVGRKSTRPLVKSSLKALDHLTSKRLYDSNDIAESYRRVHSTSEWDSESALWDDIICQFFDRMAGWHIRAIAGKFIVTVYQTLRRKPPACLRDSNGKDFSQAIWLQWLQDALATTPSLLDGMKNYIFLPLFKEDKSDSLRFLECMKEIDPLSVSTEDELDLPALLRFTALEIGKKVGIVEEPGKMIHVVIEVRTRVSRLTLL